MKPSQDIQDLVNDLENKQEAFGKSSRFESWCAHSKQILLGLTRLPAVKALSLASISQ